jgi:hypothetical protein
VRARSCVGFSDTTGTSRAAWRVRGACGVAERQKCERGRRIRRFGSPVTRLSAVRVPGDRCSTAVRGPGRLGNLRGYNPGVCSGVSCGVRYRTARRSAAVWGHRRGAVASAGGSRNAIPLAREHEPGDPGGEPEQRRLPDVVKDVSLEHRAVLTVGWRCVVRVADGAAL